MSDAAFDLLFKIRTWRNLEQVAQDREKAGFIGARVDRLQADVMHDAVVLRAAKIIGEGC